MSHDPTDLLSQQISQGFDLLGSRMDDVVTRLDRMNGSVADAQHTLATHEVKIANVIADACKKKDRALTTWDVGLFVAGGTALITALKFLGFLS